MANKSGNAYALTLLCPIKQGSPKILRHGPPRTIPEGSDLTYADWVRLQLQQLRVNEASPIARVPNTYRRRLWVLNDVPYQGHPAVLEHLKSSYLVFSSNFHGDLDTYLRGMWVNVEAEIRAVLECCVGFDEIVHDAETFIAYVKRCQVTTTFFFNGSSDEPLDEQLKSLYLKQEFSTFAFENQGKSAADLQAAFKRFVARTEPRNLARPTWRAGAYRLNTVVRP
jgi:hypothetical protein